MSVFINATGAFLPGPPIQNEHIEDVLGYVEGKASRWKKRVLQANGIKTRHYAIESGGRSTHACAELGVLAARACLDKSSVDPSAIGLLSCATTQGDLLLPGMGSMVQAELGLSGVELLTTHGVCTSGTMGLKAAFNSLRLKEHRAALVVAAELSSRMLKSSRYEAAGGHECLDFEAEFLRFMLSDGAGALLLETQPRGKCLRIDWMRSFSHAEAFPVCMSVGRAQDKRDTRTWQDYATYGEAEAAGAFLIRQDLRLLENIIKVGIEGALRLIAEGSLRIESIDHFLCHYSSHHFRGQVYDMLSMAGAAIPYEKWYTNLYQRGNTGCASIFIMLNEFLQTERPQPGARIVCMVPESGRFNTAYMHLTVVEA